MIIYDVCICLRMLDLLQLHIALDNIFWVDHNIERHLTWTCHRDQGTSMRPRLILPLEILLRKVD